jgi:phosphatidylinositol alpha-1,6-mannosyltransferase
VAGRFADHIIGVSDHTREQLRDLYRFDEDDLTTVPPGIDADRFRPTDDVHSAVDTDRESILVLSRLDPRKGIDKAIRAFAQLDRPDAELLIAGTGRLEDSLRELAAELEVSEDVRFLGFVEDEELPSLYSSVIGTQVGGVPTAVDDGETGYLVPKDGIGELATRMDELLGAPGEYERMAQGSRTWAVDHDWTAIAERVSGVYGESR